MSINISQKLGLSAALVVGIVGCFSESAEAGRFIYSGSSNNGVDAEFILDTEKKTIEKLTLEDVDGEIFATASGGVNASEFEESDLLGINPGDLDFLPAITYTFEENNLEGKLFIPFPSETENFSLEGISVTSPSIENFDTIFENNKNQNGEVRIPGLISIQGNVEQFGTPGGDRFMVTKIVKQDIPEPTTAAGLLATLFVGGLSLRKGDRRVKSKAIIKN
ncbi:MAG: PEP-CTERM sorting domain-containing protein [Cyanobacteria bacterium J06632_19]